MIFRLQKNTKDKVAKKKKNYTQRLGSNVSGMMTISSRPYHEMGLRGPF